MDWPHRHEDLIVGTSVERHLALAPVGFAVTEGPEHTVLYANAMFHQMQSAGKIRIGPSSARAPTSAADLTPLLDQAFRSAATVRDAILEPLDAQAVRCSCTIWPVAGAGDRPEKLVIEIRDVELMEGAKVRQRAVTEQLLLGALREQDAGRRAEELSGRADYLAKASRDLSMSLDEEATRNTVRRLALPRPGTWCIVDVVESNGAIHRLAVVHPDPAQQARAKQLEGRWSAAPGQVIDLASVPRTARPVVFPSESVAAMPGNANGAEELRILREIGFGSLLVVPLIVRAKIQGAITFVSRKADPPFTAEEIALAVDLTARCALALDNARLYREADGLRLAAELANQSKSEFLGSMSHELRTPLNAIGGFAELIEMGIHGPVTGEQHVALARIRANQRHLLVLITEILNFVRIESGRMEYRDANVSMPHALVEVAEMLTGVIREKGLTLDQPPDAPEAVARGDPNRVRQILVNLLMNAVKYTDRGSITLRCAVVGSSVESSVEDTGPGILPSELEAIFEPFVQLTGGLHERRGGVGLGLAISQDLARAMHGRLAVESTVGVGSRFTLTLPLASTRRATS